MNASNKKKNKTKELNVNEEMKIVPNVERSFESDFVCNIILRDILIASEDIISRKEYLKKLIEESKCKDSEKFTKKSCGSVLDNYFVDHECLSPKMIYETSPHSPIKSPHSFLNYDEIISETENDDVLTVKREPWEKRRDSSKIYNCNKIFVVKKTKKPKDILEESFSFQKSNSNIQNSEIVGRHSNKNELSKISISHNVFVPRLSNRGRLTVNPFPASTRVSPKNTFIQIDSPEKNRSSIFESKENIKNQIDHTKLIKLDLKRRKSEEKSFKTIENEKETNTYITYLRDRKEKLENIMKDFDQDEITKKNEKIERDVLMRESKTENLAEAYSKVPLMTTDYNGNIMRVYEPKIVIPVNQTVNNASETKLSRYEINNEGALIGNVGFKIKDIDDKTKNFLNQIFSSFKAAPSKSGKRIIFNGFEQTKKCKEKIDKNLNSNISLIEDEKNMKKSKVMFQPSIKALEVSKPKIIINEKEKIAKSLSKSDLATSKKNVLLYNQKPNKENEKVELSIGELGKIYREEYQIKKERIHPKILKTKKSSTTTRKSDEISTESQSKKFSATQSPELNAFFDIIKKAFA